MDKLNESKIKILQNYEFQLQQLLTQKQEFQASILEISNALNEIKDKDEAYEIVGSVMVKKSVSEIESNLNEKKELIEIKLNAINKHEKIIKDKAESLQKELVDSANKTKN